MTQLVGLPLKCEAGFVKRKILYISIIIIIVLALFIGSLYTISSRTFVPISDVVESLHGIRSMECSKIELQYQDLTSSGSGNIKKIVVDDTAEIERFEELVLQTFCRKNNRQLSTGSTNVQVTFSFSNNKSVTIETLADGGVQYKNKYYSTNNELGTYFTDYVLTKK